MAPPSIVTNSHSASPLLFPALWAVGWLPTVQRRRAINSVSDLLQVNSVRIYGGHQGHTHRQKCPGLRLLGSHSLSCMFSVGCWFFFYQLSSETSEHVSASRCGLVRTISSIQCFKVFIKSLGKKELRKDWPEDVGTTSSHSSSLIKFDIWALKTFCRCPGGLLLNFPSKQCQYHYVLLKSGYMLWERHPCMVSSLHEHYSLYIHKPRQCRTIAQCGFLMQSRNLIKQDAAWITQWTVLQ
jgi:hypothetical protein